MISDREEITSSKVQVVSSFELGDLRTDDTWDLFMNL